MARRNRKPQPPKSPVAELPQAPCQRLDRGVVLLALVALTLPAAIAMVLPWVPALGSPPELLASRGTSFAPAALNLQQRTMGEEPQDQPLITHVQIADLDRDGQSDVLVCDARRNAVLWYRRDTAGKWQEEALGDADLAAPCHVSVVDLDGDGDNDVVVAVLGSVWPTDDFVGRVVWLENLGQKKFTTRVLMDDVRRISDVQAGDLDGDGDPDLVAAEFGYDHGRIFWLESRGGGEFRDRELLAVPGTIHVPIRDFDGDGDRDVAALISQEEEQVAVFVNQGERKFEPSPRTIFASPNFDLGSSGLFPCDLNRDGKEDLLLTAGDNLEIEYPCPQAWHGCIWLENKGDWKFSSHRIASAAGVYAAAAGDLDGDGDEDVVLACMFNDWRQAATSSLVWLENDGKQSFTPHQIADRPSHLASVAMGDVNGDGMADVIAGSLHLQEPFDRLGRVTAWLSQEKRPARKEASK